MLPILLVAAAFLQASEPPPTFPKYAMWGKGFFSPDTMECDPPSDPSAKEPEILCRGENESKHFQCGDGSPLRICQTVVAVQQTTKNGNFSYTTTKDMQLKFFQDSLGYLRFIQDPALEGYLKPDPQAASQYALYQRNRKYTLYSSIGMTVSSFALVGVVLMSQFDNKPALIGTGAAFLACWGAKMHFGTDLDEKLMKAVETFRSNFKSGKKP